MIDIQKIAREAGFDPHDMSDDFTCNIKDIERFAHLLREAERERCAKVCEHIGQYDESVDDYYSDVYAAAIRGQK